VNVYKLNIRKAQIGNKLKQIKMDIIEKLAKKSFQDNIEYSDSNNSRDKVNNIKYLLYDFNSELDKIKFLNFHIDLTNEKYKEHLEVCNDLENCSINEEYETLIFYLQESLKELGVKMNDDTFTFEEKEVKDSQLEEILKQFEEVKLGNQIIYDDILKEINELKELYFLGKKNWTQLLAGKIVEMTAGGIISETVSKDILCLVKPTLGNLLK
jgi:hypothetical protein